MNNTLPFEIPYSIATDANGNGSSTYNFGNDYWYAVTVTGTGSGNPSWVIQRNGIFFQPGIGPAVVLDGGKCAPGTALKIIVTKATPNSTVTGLIYGDKANSPSDLNSAGSGSNSFSITQQQSAQRVPLYPDGTPPQQQGIGKPSFVVPAGSSVTKTFTLPPNTTNIRVSSVDTTIGFPVHSSITLIGVQTGIQYQESNNVLLSLNITKPLDFRVSPEWDPQVNLTFDTTSLSTFNANVFVSAMQGSETTVIAGLSDAIIPVTKAPYQWDVTGSFTNTTPSLTQAGLGQAQITVDAIMVALMSINSAVVTPEVQILDNSSTIIWQEWMAVSSTATVPGIDKINITEAAILSLIINGQLKIQLDRAIPANVFCSMYMAGYIE